MDYRDVIKAITAVRDAGIELPATLDIAYQKSKRTVSGLLTTTEAEARVIAADTPEDFDTAVCELQRVMAVASIKPEAVKTKINHLHQDHLAEVLAPVADDLYAEIGRRYNDAAPAFAEAVGRVPDLTGRGPMDMAPNEAQALHDAKSTLVPLHALLTAYQALGKPLGHPLPAGRTGPDASRIVASIGDGLTDPEQHHQAVSLVYGYARNDTSLSLAALAPHVAVVRAGGTLQMVHPRDAASRLVIVPDAPREQPVLSF